MKIRWQKIAAGIYQSDSGRWRIQKFHDGKWYIWDTKYPTGYPKLYGDRLREAKQLVDDQIDNEATNV